MEKYTVSVFNTITRTYEDVEVTKEVYEVYRRSQWAEENDDRRFYTHQIPFTDLTGNEDDIEENFHEFVEASVLRFEESFFKDPEVDVKGLVRDVLSSLKEKDRMIIEEFYFKNKTEQEIADVLGVGQAAVCKRKQRILLRLKKEILKKVSEKME